MACESCNVSHGHTLLAGGKCSQALMVRLSQRQRQSSVGNDIVLFVSGLINFLLTLVEPSGKMPVF